MAGTISSLKKSGSIIGPAAIIAGVGFIAYAAYKALGGGRSDNSSAAGQFTMGGEDPDEYKGLYAGQDPIGYPENKGDLFRENKEPQLAAEVDALKQTEAGTGSNSETLYDPHDNPIPSSTEGFDISTQTLYPTPQERQQADFLSQHPVAGWSLVGASLIPSYFSRAGTRVGVRFAESIAPDLAAKRGISSATEAAIQSKSLDKQAMSFLDRQVMKSAEKNLGEEAAQAGIKVAAKKGLVTGAKIGIKSIPLIGLGAGIAIDKASGIGTAQAITRNVVGDVVGGFTGAVGALGGPVGSFGGAVGGQIGGEQFTDYLFKKGGGMMPAKPLTAAEKQGLAAANPKLGSNGLFGFSGNEAIMGGIFRPSNQPTANAKNRESAASVLAQANAWRAAQSAGPQSPSQFQQAASLDAANRAAVAGAVRNTTPGRATITQNAIVGPTGNMYTLKPGTTNQYAYSAGPTTPVLGASAGSSGAAQAARTTAQKAETAAAITKATTGPKVSAVGKYKAVKTAPKTKKK
ncbi:hypothetical protein [Candidatus Magnetobacterium casense]|uniref:Uncharacterized protein n=1 Tax=Candidatus Magnetobacterium casense TaxID=1455061 RepID=A0ABS6RUR8_9BACT|nr:hypothetical protein [Candidatus Magnetobacterium casensis]MBV6340363.1 hypothetical protein [Candidatus Magnetobacterium casensis]